VRFKLFTLDERLLPAGSYRIVTAGAEAAFLAPLSVDLLAPDAVRAPLRDGGR